MFSALNGAPISCSGKFSLAGPEGANWKVTKVEACRRHDDLLLDMSKRELADVTNGNDYDYDDDDYYYYDDGYYYDYGYDYDDHY